jgi:type IV secretion system protein VirB5
MPFQHKSKTYKTDVSPNPFLEGQDKAYADILADKMKEMRWWRGIVGGGVLALFLISLVFFIYAVNQQEIVPVLVNVMPSGETQYLGEVHRSANVTVPEAAVQYQIRRFVTNLRSVSIDSQILYNNIEECYAMATASYEPVMTKFLLNASPFNLVGKMRRTVEIESLIKITGSSYQADWLETATDNSQAKKTTRVRAIITVQLIPSTDEAIKTNPLGIYIDNCEMVEL